LWGGATQVGVQAIQLAKLAGCSPIIVTASKKVSCNKSPIRSILHLLVWKHEIECSLHQHEEYLKSLGADFVLDYKDPSIEAQIRAYLPPDKVLRHAFDCAGAYPEAFKSVVEPGGSIVLALANRGDYPNHRVERAIGGYIHVLGAFDAATFSYNAGTERDEKAGRIARELIAWTMTELRTDVGERKYQPPRVRRLGGRGMYDALEAFRLMKRNEISGEKVVYWMEETPEVQVTRK
jgi:NADPH:quinone reductase-like Zn-dependent oxidoreductase